MPRRNVVFATALFLGLGSAFLGCTPRTQAPAAEAASPVPLTGGVIRHDLRFPCGSTTCAGWLYEPPGVEDPPVVVMGNGFSGTRDVAIPPFAEAFARRGLAAFAFDYRCFGASGGSPRQLVDPWMQLDDWRAALAFVRGLDAVDGERLAIWGTSMGGGLVLVIGAEDAGVSAVVSQVPAVDSDAEAEGPEFGVALIARLLLTAWADLARSLVADDAILIPAFAEPGGFGMIVDDVSYRDLQKAPDSSPESTYRNAIAARSITTFDNYNPADSWDALAAPTLVVATEADRLAAFEAVERLAAANPNVRVERFEGSHFDVYRPPVSEWAADTQASFLEVELSGAGS
jgi:alpha-beta hydrolase superfamily lysophospholipase